LTSPARVRDKRGMSKKLEVDVCYSQDESRVRKGKAFLAKEAAVRDKLKLVRACKKAANHAARLRKVKK
jgi:hypothetical protein